MVATPVEAETPRRTRLGRQRQVIAVLTRHGFGLLVQRSPVPLPRLARLRGNPEGLRQALEELGATFIKLGQVLSTRSDILPESYTAALSRLQDRLPPIPVDDVRETIRRELGAPPEILFAVWEESPLATASIGQVHAATTLTGEQVVIKVQKPGITHEVEMDLLILRDLAHLAADRIDAPILRSLQEVVEQFSDGLRDELDYIREGRNAERFQRALSHETQVIVPRIHWDLTTSKVLTMSRVRGVKINDLPALAQHGIDRRELAHTLARVVLRQIFEHGFFHADPHPGNYFVQGDGQLAIVDFGLMGSLDDFTRRELLLLLAAWVKGDADGIADGLISLGVAHGGTQLISLRMDIRRLVGRYHDVQLRDIDFGRVLGDLLSLARRHHLVLRGDLALMAKTLAMHEALAASLDPQFHLVGVARPYVERALRHMYFTPPDPQVAALNAGAMFNLALNFPQRAERLLGRIERGDLGVSVRPEGLDPVMRDLNRMVNRLSVSILAAAFIVGLALLLQVVETSHGSLLLLGIFAGGLFGAAILGLWLLISMYRAGRSH